MLKKRLIIPALLASAIAVHSAGAAEITQVGSYAASSISIRYDHEQPHTPMTIVVDERPVTGLTKFNPAIGHLTGVRFDGAFSWNYSHWFDAQGIQNTTPGSYYSAQMTFESQAAVVWFVRDAEPNAAYWITGDGPGGTTTLEGSGNVGDGGEVSTGDSGAYFNSYSQDLFTGSITYADFTRSAPDDIALDNMTAGVYVGASADFHLINMLASWGEAAVSLDEGSFTMTYVYSITGDANGDDLVGFDDLLVLAQNYNASGTLTWQQGDFTGDGNVDFDDLLILAQRYNTSATPDSAASSFAADWARAQQMVPEPTTLLAGLAALAFTAGRRRS